MRALAQRSVSSNAERGSIHSSGETFCLNAQLKNNQSNSNYDHSKKFQCETSVRTLRGGGLEPAAANL